VASAHNGGALPVDEALELIASKIDALDMSADFYDREVAELLRLGATIWALAEHE